MANTMLRNPNNRNNRNLISEIRQFANNLQRTGKDPNVLLNELLASGRYSNEQVEQAKRMAKIILGGK